MRILLAAINAKYIHSNLAVYSLRRYAEKAMDAEGYGEKNAEHPGHIQIEIAEYTVNQYADDILEDLYTRHPDVLLFSCYIWNISYVCRLVREMRKICPGLPIWLGGPEVSYDAKDVLERLPEAKGVIKGEGEETFAELCKTYARMKDTADINVSHIRGITYRRLDGTICENPWRETLDLTKIPFVYNDMDSFEHKIIYYETSRGCPYSCSYCLSSVDKNLRFRDTKLAEKELGILLGCGVPQVKFVDRTFNLNHRHAMEIWSYIAEHDTGKTNFHFEIAADLLNEEELRLMESMRPGLIQLEIGVQSTNPATISAIRRKMDFEAVRKNVERIHRAGNIHQHLDLIAGLPYEDITSFAKSFDDVYALEPEMLQLGFLKVLKGSSMDSQKDTYGLVCQDAPPYEVLYTRWLSYGDIIRLKAVERMVETYYNSGQFTNTLKLLGREYDSAFRMYDDLAGFYSRQSGKSELYKRSVKYDILLAFAAKVCREKTELFREALIFDYYLRENAKSRPQFAGDYTVGREELKEFYEQEAVKRRYLIGYESYNSSQMRKMTHIERFRHSGKTVLFDYLNRDPLHQEARVYCLE